MTAPNAGGHRTTMVDGTGTSTRTYDVFGQRVSGTNGAGSTVGYEYDPNGNRTAIVYQGGMVLTRTFATRPIAS